MAIAMELERLNRERQEIEWRIIDAASLQAEESLGAEMRTPVIVVAGEGWHPGVLGLVAARLKERYNLPAFALGFAGDSMMASGSGRSIAGVDMGAAVKAAAEAGLIVKGGGHAMAAGLSVERAKLGALRGFLEERFAGPVAAARMRNVISIDGALSARAASLDLVDLLERAGPYGAGNPLPVFAFPAHRIIYADGAGADHVRCTIEAGDGARLKAIAFRSLSTPLGELLLSERQLPLHVAGRLAADDWGGARHVQLMIDDVAEVR
jgi:single-stranded-DNA-specific exonuclease